VTRGAEEVALAVPRRQQHRLAGRHALAEMDISVDIQDRLARTVVTMTLLPSQSGSELPERVGTDTARTEQVVSVTNDPWQTYLRPNVWSAYVQWLLPNVPRCVAAPRISTVCSSLSLP